MENGIYFKWTDDMFYSASHGFNNIGVSRTAAYQVFTIENVNSVLNVFYIGIAISLIVAIFEALTTFKLIFILSAIRKFLAISCQKPTITL